MRYSFDMALKTLTALAIIGLAAQALPPLPGQTTGTPSDAGSPAQQHSQRKKDVSAKPVPVHKTNSPVGVSTEGHDLATQNKEQNGSLTRITGMPPVSIADKYRPGLQDVYDWGPWAFSLLLVVVGIIGIIVAWRTLGTMNRQANLMRTQATLMERQADLMQAGMTQWVSIQNWEVSLIQRLALPIHGRLQIKFEIANESNLPLAMEAVFEFVEWGEP
jgi:hypothetical protein